METIEKWNYIGNETAVQIGTRRFYFSYNTLIAFVGTNSKGKFFDCVIQNLWSVTTGKHLNAIDGGDKKSRFGKKEFEKQLQEFMQ